MNTLPLDLYKVLEFGLGNDTWQQFVDHYLEKYDATVIDGFEFMPTQLGYTFSQLIASTGATTLPAYVDPESPGYESALREVQGMSGNIPTQKKFYRLNRVILQERLQLIQQVGRAALTPEMQRVFMGLLDESTDGLIQAYYNSLTHQRMQIVSTGKFVIDTVNNPRGLKGITIDFGIDPSHFDTLTSGDRWWTDADHTTANEGATSDPIKYIKDKVKKIRKENHFYGAMHVEMTQDLLDDLLGHSKVLERIGQMLMPNVTGTAAQVKTAQVTYAQNLSDEAKANYLGQLCGIKIVARDTYSFVDVPGTGADGKPDLVTTQVENFKKENISFVPDGKIGNIMGVTPLTLGYEPSKVASYNDGRLILSQRAIPETHSIYIESEAAQLCVPSVPQGMFISTVTV